MSDPEFELEFAGVITADRFPRRSAGRSGHGRGAGRLLSDHRPSQSGWVNKLALNELVEQTRARKGRRSHERRHAR